MDGLSRLAGITAEETLPTALIADPGVVIHGARQAFRFYRERDCEVLLYVSDRFDYYEFHGTSRYLLIIINALMH